MNKLTPEQLKTLLEFAIKFEIDAALAIAPHLSGGSTIDDAIAALEVAKTKTADQYRDDAAAQLPQG